MILHSVCKSRPPPVAFLLSVVRAYNPQTLINLPEVKARERSKSLQLQEHKARTFKPALDHFRLTRFGWEHRKAGSSGERRRKRSHKACVLASRVGFVNPRDYKMMRIYFPHMVLSPRLTPVDTNVNLRSERNLLGRHIG